MAYPEIIQAEWILGDGSESTELSPSNTYFEGAYDVSVKVTFEDGTTSILSANDFIIVTEVNKNLFQQEYIDHPVSLHYGFDSENAGGWSKNSGSSWVYPESAGAIMNEEINGVNWLYVWDMWDDKQYCINTQNTGTSSISYLDKGTIPIEGSATLGGATANMKSDFINHLETTVRISNDIDSKDIADTLSVSLGIIMDEDGDPVEIIEDVESDVEQSFRVTQVQDFGEQSVQQLKVSSNTSEFNIQNIESFYKRTRKAKLPATDYSSDVETFFATSLTDWVSTPNYALNKWTGSYIDVNGGSNITGPIDGAFGFRTVGEFSIGNTTTSGTLFFLSKSAPVISGVTLTEYGSIGIWKGYYSTGVIPANITFPVSTDIFDVRIFTQAITEDYINVYLTDIKRFIPGA